jgi:hypothetical protein
VPVLAVDQDRTHAEGAGAFDVLLDRVADHDCVFRSHIEALERRLEDRRMRLDAAVRP